MIWRCRYKIIAEAEEINDGSERLFFAFYKIQKTDRNA